MPASEPAAESTSFDVSNDPVEVEAIAADTPLTEPTVDAPPAASPQAPSDVPIAPWTAAANAGVSLGKRSKQGGVATGAFFSRLGKRIAGSF
jgi:hypothetical protein